MSGVEELEAMAASADQQAADGSGAAEEEDWEEDDEEGDILKPMDPEGTVVTWSERNRCHR